MMCVVYVESSLMAHARLANILEMSVHYVRLVSYSDTSRGSANSVSSNGEVWSFFSHGISLLIPESFIHECLPLLALCSHLDTTRFFQRLMPYVQTKYVSCFLSSKF